MKILCYKKKTGSLLFVSNKTTSKLTLKHSTSIMGALPSTMPSTDSPNTSTTTQTKAEAPDKLRDAIMRGMPSNMPSTDSANTSTTSQAVIKACDEFIAAIMRDMPSTMPSTDSSNKSTTTQAEAEALDKLMNAINEASKEKIKKILSEICHQIPEARKIVELAFLPVEGASASVADDSSSEEFYIHKPRQPQNGHCKNLTKEDLEEKAHPYGLPILRYQKCKTCKKTFDAYSNLVCYTHHNGMS